MLGSIKDTAIPLAQDRENMLARQAMREQTI